MCHCLDNNDEWRYSGLGLPPSLISSDQRSSSSGGSGGSGGCSLPSISYLYLKEYYSTT